MLAIFLLFLIAFNAIDASQYSVHLELAKPNDGVDGDGDGDGDGVGDGDGDGVEHVKPIAQYPGSCAEALAPWRHSGIYKIQIAESGLKPFFVYCQEDPQGGPAWTVFQRRIDGSINFYRNWEEYVNGFGNLGGEYFIGLDKLHAMTDLSVNELWIQMEDFENQTRYAKYSTFAITDKTQDYTLNLLGKFSGNAGDSLTDLAGQKFSTKDRKNDNFGKKSCAQEFTGAWWYNACHKSNLNGQYLHGSYSKDQFAKGINWESWHGFYYSLKYVHMAIRPKELKVKSVFD